MHAINAKTHRYHDVIKETCLDSFGHVNNAAYLTLLEEARWDLVAKNGYGLDVIKQTGLGPTILSVTLKFSKELHARDEVVIETQMEAYEKKIGKLTQRIMRGDEMCCEARFVIGLFCMAKRKLVLPTDAWLHALGIEKSLD
ncbi:MAG: acyl-CoA thioesterase [Legionellaceae bacterium]|nr:acyl-CoA thioesterase [Legionellaceae bacterium]